MLPPDALSGGGIAGFPATRRSGRKALPADLEALVASAERLGEHDRASLLAFAEFLASRSDAADAPDSPPARLPQPELQPRPENESVIRAMRRLSASYSMIERGKLLNETSSLMAQHVMQGRAADAVIDDLERLFADRYADFCKDWHQRHGGDHS